MAILIESDANGSAIVPMLEREGLRVEVTRSPEQALERLQQIVLHRPGGFSPPPEASLWAQGGIGAVAPAAGGPVSGGLDRRLAAVQERARSLEHEEQRIIGDAVHQAAGNKTAAARLLGISRYALQRRLRRFAKPQPPS